MNFELFVRDLIASNLKRDYLLDALQQGLLRDIVEDCFLAEGYTLEADQKAYIILSTLFTMLVPGFTFPDVHDSRFLTDLLYHIYYLNLPLDHLRSKESLLFYLATHHLSLFDKMDEMQKRKCLVFCMKNFDEGAYAILQHAKGAYPVLDLVFKSLVTPEEAASVLLENKAVDWRVACKSLDLPYSRAEIEHFVSIFGLYGHQVPKEAWDELKEYDFLGDKMSALKDVCIAHLEALLNDRSCYVNGLSLITYALPTAGKELSRYAWLPSITESIEGFCKEFGIKNEVPIYIFDQSSPELFEKNSRFIAKVNPHARHLSTEDMLFLGRALQIEALFITDTQGRFGFGGARNAIFLLTPLIRFYDGQKIDFRTLSSERIRADFHNIVLEEKGAPCIIHMGDDDVHVPYATVFSDALFAWQHKEEYFCRFGWVKGRKTTWTETSFNLEYILERVHDILLQHIFQDEPFRHGMAGLLSKPKLCLNVPFGQEEAYLLAMQEYLFDLRQPMLHLSGYRFPHEKIPQNRFVGLAAFLKAHYSYSIGSMLVSDLLDPLNFYNRCSLPWNMHEKPFKSLLDAIECITDPAGIEMMQKAFTKNIKNLESGLHNYQARKYEKSDLALFHISVLEEQDVDSLLNKYSRFPKEMKELKAQFSMLADDVKSFKKVLKGEKVEDRLPITHALLLLIDVIMSASFQKTLKNLNFNFQR